MCVCIMKFFPFRPLRIDSKKNIPRWFCVLFQSQLFHDVPCPRWTFLTLLGIRISKNSNFAKIMNGVPFLSQENVCHNIDFKNDGSSQSLCTISIMIRLPLLTCRRSVLCCHSFVRPCNSVAAVVVDVIIRSWGPVPLFGKGPYITVSM